MGKKVDELARGIIEGEEKALAKGLTFVENRSKGYRELLDSIYPEVKPCPIWGLTGAPGVGKSTITNYLVDSLASCSERIGVLAVDPTSPFSGGAILGDRVRMMDLAGREGIFIRSMASRGALGGLSPAIMDAVALYQAFGVDRILVETVGVGQSETDIVSLADTVAVIMMPGTGDDVQTIKAGLLEIGDIFVVNKADLEGAETLAGLLQSMLSSRNEDEKWVPPVIKLVASQGQNLDTLLEKFQDHQKTLEKSGQKEKKEKMRNEMALKMHLQARFQDLYLGPLLGTEDWEKAIKSINRREKSPAYWAEKLISGSD